MIRDWSKYLSAWERVQIAALTALRHEIDDRCDLRSILTSHQIAKIKNRACQRARLAEGAIASRGPNSRRAASRAALKTSGNPAAQTSEA